MKYVRVLTPSEAKYKYIPLSREAREEFPEKDKKFKLKFKDKIYQLSVNNRDWIMITPLYEIHQFAEGNEVTINTDNEIFELKVK